MSKSVDDRIERLRSYCSVCDAERCDHQDHRYLDPICYLPTEHGWKVPDGAERERFYDPPRLPGGASAIEHKPKELQHIVVELEAWMALDAQLESELRRAYEMDPRAVSLIAQNVIDGSREGKLHNPGGLLWSKLRARSDFSEQTKDVARTHSRAQAASPCPSAGGWRG